MRAALIRLKCGGCACGLTPWILPPSFGFWNCKHHPILYNLQPPNVAYISIPIRTIFSPNKKPKSRFAPCPPPSQASPPPPRPSPNLPARRRPRPNLLAPQRHPKDVQIHQRAWSHQTRSMAARLESTLMWWRFESEWTRSHYYTAPNYDGLNVQAVAPLDRTDGELDRP